MPGIESVILENFRCFRERQTVGLAPLTLLVGENSTGKTSFLALVRLLADLGMGRSDPDFKEAPYDLGSMGEIVYDEGDRGGRAERLAVGCSTEQRYRGGDQYGSRWVVSREYTFVERGTVPELVARFTSARLGRVWIDERIRRDGTYDMSVGHEKRVWRLSFPQWGARRPSFDNTDFWFRRTLQDSKGMDYPPEGHESGWFVPADDRYPLESRDIDELIELYFSSDEAFPSLPYASAPVRSKPLRTYDPARTDQDPEGRHVPMYLADLRRRSFDNWELLKERLENFGRASGLFDEVKIRQLGSSASDPFQVQIRKDGRRWKGLPRNLIDVGYGVSQVLPLLAELLREDSARQYLLQQPEVHLHPSAQAALGSLFCDLAASRRQLIVETHSDHLIDRVRMEVRDGTTDLKPEDVMVLYFERNELDVKIHEIRFDELGNVCGAPDSYGDFMMQETRRSLGL